MRYSGSLPEWEDIKSCFKGPWFVACVLVLLLSVGGWGYFHREYYSPAHPYQYIYTDEELKVKADLESELRSLKPLPGAVYQSMKSYGEQHSFWWVYSYFGSKLDLPSVINHYDVQLKAHGWHQGDGAGGPNQYVSYTKNAYIIEIKEYQDKVYVLQLSWQKANESTWFLLFGQIIIFIVFLMAIVYWGRRLFRGLKRNT